MASPNKARALNGNALYGTTVSHESTVRLLFVIWCFVLFGDLNEDEITALEKSVSEDDADDNEDDDASDDEQDNDGGVSYSAGDDDDDDKTDVEQGFVLSDDENDDKIDDEGDDNDGNDSHDDDDGECDE